MLEFGLVHVSVIDIMVGAKEFIEVLSSEILCLRERAFQLNIENGFSDFRLRFEVLGEFSLEFELDCTLEGKVLYLLAGGAPEMVADWLLLVLDAVASGLSDSGVEGLLRVGLGFGGVGMGCGEVGV